MINRFSDIQYEINKILEIQDIIKDQTNKSTMVDEIKNINNAKKYLMDMVEEISDLAKDLLKKEVDSELAVSNGTCQFPLDCKKRYTCKVKICNADVCTNGFAYKMS